MEQFGKKQPRKNYKNHGVVCTQQTQHQQQQRRHFNPPSHNPNLGYNQQQQVNKRLPFTPFLAYATTPEERYQRQSNIGGAPPKKQRAEDQVLLCPKCTRYYQLTRQEQQFGFTLHGPAYSSLPGPFATAQRSPALRLPYVLPCDHTICGDCVRAAHAQHSIKCAECDACATIDGDKCFAINYYLVGRIYLLRDSSQFVGDGGATGAGQYQAESIPHFVRANIPPQLNQRPPPYNYNEPSPMRVQEYGAGELNRSMIDMGGDGRVNGQSERCSMKSCAAPASLNCVNCEAIFCAACSNVLHGGEIAGLKDHRTRPLQPQLLPNCPKHAANVLDFHCVQCDVDLCCYCLIEGGHAGHEHTRLTVLSEDQKVGFKELISNVEEKLRKLENTYKLTEQHINVSIGNGQQQTTAENKQHQQLHANINKHFADLIAKLLNTQHRLRQKLDLAQHACAVNLRSIQLDVAQRLHAGKNLLSQGQLVFESCDQTKAATAIFNVTVLRRELEKILDWPSCLVYGDDKSVGHIEFISDLSENIDKFCTLKVHDANEFQLVPEDGVPSGYSVAKSADIARRDYADSSSQSSYQSNVSSVASTSKSRQSDFKPTSGVCFSKTPSPKQSTNIIATPTVGARMAVTVVHINNPESIYVQLLENLPIFKSIHNDLANYVKSLSTSEVPDPIMGELYIVKQNIHWVRARCLKSSRRANFFIAQLLETGQMIEVLKLHMRECSAQFRNIPPMAYHCRLNNLYPYDKEWSIEAKKLLENILVLKSGYVSPFYSKHKIGEIESCNVSMQIINRDNNIYSVELIVSREDLSTVLTNALLFTGLAKPIDTSNDEYNLKTIDGIKIYENTSKIDIYQRMRVSLVHVEDPYNIYVHLYNFLSHIKDLIRNMNLYYLENNRGIIYTPRIGMYVSVVYAEGNSYNWYRGKIVNVINGVGKVDVLLIDFGKTVNVDYKNLRTLPVTFTMLECQAVRIRLADIAPLDTQSSEWPEATMEFLREFIKAPGHHLEIAVTEVLTAKSCAFVVVLFECLPLVHYCMNAQLVEAGLAISTGRLSSADHIAWPQGGSSADGNSSDDSRSFLVGQRSSSSSTRLIDGTPSFTLDLLKTIQGSDGVQIEQEEEEDDDDEDDVRVGKGRAEVDVLMVKSPDEIYIKIKSRDPEIIQLEPNLTRRLQLHYGSGVAASARSVDTTWQKGDNIVAYNYRTTQYHRGIIVQVLGEGNNGGYIVLCRDRAIEFKAESSAIYPLAEDFTQVPYLAKRVRLANIQPIGGNKWSLLATDIVSTMCNLGNSDSADSCRANQKYYYRKMGEATYTAGDGELSQPGILWVCNLVSSGPLERSRYKYRSINKKLIHGGVAVSDTHTNPHIARHAHSSPSTHAHTQRISSPATGSPSVEGDAPADLTPEQKRLPRLLTPSRTANAMMRAFADLSGDADERSATEGESSASGSDAGAVGRKRSRMVMGSDDSSTKSSVRSADDRPTKISPLLAYPAPLPLPERRFVAIATNVDEVAHVYLHPEQLAPVLATLDNNIQQSVKLYNQKMTRDVANTKMHPRTFRVGELCTVRFHMDKKWYRGKVTHVIPCNTAGGSAFEYRVQMVDYGNIEQVKYTDLCALALCPTVPIITTRVRLHQVEPKCGPWNTSVLDSIHSLVVAKTVDVHLCDKMNASGKIPDAILRIDGTNINDYLLREFDCLCRGKDNNNDESDDDVVIIEESDTSLITPLEQQPQSNPLKSDDLKIFPDLAVGDKRLVRVIDVLNINVVTVEMAPDNINSLKSKYEEVFSSFNNADIEHEILNDIRDGVHCLARYSVDNQYYRAEIMSILPPSISSIDGAHISVHVFYLDYGNREIVASSQLRSLTPYDPLVRRLPALARMVALHCIRPLPMSPRRAQLQDSALDQLMQLLQQKEVVMEVIRSDPKLSVNLLQPSTDLLIYEGLITDGLVIRANNDDSDDDYY